MRGTEPGLLLVASLTSDLMSGTLDFVNPGEKCATKESFCEESLPTPLEIDFIGTSEKGEQESSAEATFSKMILVDD